MWILWFVPWGRIPAFYRMRRKGVNFLHKGFPNSNSQVVTTTSSLVSRVHLIALTSVVIRCFYSENRFGDQKATFQTGTDSVTHVRIQSAIGEVEGWYMQSGRASQIIHYITIASRNPSLCWRFPWQVLGCPQTCVFPVIYVCARLHLV